MATQRLSVATLAGQAAVAVAEDFARWRAAPDPAAVDRLCAAVRDNALALPVVYFAEWVDRWLMGDLVPGPGAVMGHRFEAACLTPAEAAVWADGCGDQFREQGWLATRLREAGGGWGAVADRYTVVVIREPVDVSTTDDQVRAALGSIPAWLPRRDQAAEPGARHGSASGPACGC